jgi:putative RNA 2'-phosphotransferase
MPTNSKLSKFLSLILRHKPEAVGLSLDAQGWAPIDVLIAKCSRAGKRFTRQELLDVVASNEKKRFTVSDDGKRIRAAQGHSIEVKLGLAPIEPPETLFHGTATHCLDAIFAEGLVPKSRQQVHLSADAATAHRVGQRHGKPVILSVEALRLHHEGHAFYQADNGVWLTDHVPPAYLSFGVAPALASSGGSRGDDPLLAYSQGKLGRDEAIGLLGIRDYAELLVALGDADLPMPLPPPDDVENQALAFARIWKQA